MVRGRRNEDPGSSGRSRRVDKFGETLLELRDALRKAESCRRTLQGKGFPQRRWLEIVKDIDPHLRFMARPQLLDAIIVYLQSAGGPVDRDQLARELSAQKVDTLERVRRVISQNLDNGRLVLHPGNKIGLPQ